MTLTQKLFSFDGRLRRRDWWLLSIGIAVANLILGDLLRYALFGSDRSIFFGGGWNAWLAMAEPEAGLISLGFSLLLVWPCAAIYVKRHHDRGGGPVIPLAALAWSYLYSAAAFAFPLAGEVGPALTVAFAGLSLANVGVNIWIIILFGIMDGTPGTNRYGPSPKA